MSTFDAETDSWSKEEACIELTNHLIVLCKLSFPRVSSLSDITSQLFVLLFEKITGVVPYDLITEPQNIEHEAHNIQIIIDTLSLDILNISLSHIMGEDIIAGNALSIYNLLEVLENFLLYPSFESEESTAAISEFPMKDKNVNVLSGHKQFIVASTQQSLDPEKLSFDRFPRDGESHLPTIHLNQDEKVGTCSKFSYYDKLCPLCTYPNKETADLNNENGNAMNQNKSEMPLRDSSQSSMTAYQALPEELGASMSLKFLSNETVISSSPPVQEHATSESSTLISPLIPECHSNNILNPEFAKIGLDSEQNNIDAQAKHQYAGRELQDLQRENISVIPSQENEKQRLTQSAESLHMINNKMLLSPKEKMPLSSNSKYKVPVKKNVRFCSQGVTRNHQLSNEAMKRKYNSQSKRYFEDRIKDCVEELEPVVESSGFVNAVYTQLFDFPQLSSSSSKTNVYLPRNVSNNTIPKRRIRKIHHRKNARNSLERENLVENNQFLQELQREFPYLYLSPASLHRMQQQYNHHLHTVGNHLRDMCQKKSCTQIQYEEAERRKAILSQILHKDIAYNRRMRLLHEQRQNHQRARAAIRDDKQNRVQMKQLYDSYQQYVKQKIMRKRTKEERLLSQLYQDGLSMHKEELRELRKQAKEREEKEAEKHRKHLESMENFYQSQFSMLAESLAAEKQNFQERAKAQARVLDQMRRDYRQQMENEVKSLQQQLAQDDDIHFREMDAERIRNMWHKKGICPFFSKSPNRTKKSNR